jgi:hypothetical protein
LERDQIGDEIARMTTGLIKYLLMSDRKDRGLGHRKGPRSQAPDDSDCRLPTSSRFFTIFLSFKEKPKGYNLRAILHGP